MLDRSSATPKLRASSGSMGLADRRVTYHSRDDWIDDASWTACEALSNYSKQYRSATWSSSGRGRLKLADDQRGFFYVRTTDDAYKASACSQQGQPCMEEPRAGLKRVDAQVSVDRCEVDAAAGAVSENV